MAAPTVSRRMAGGFTFAGVRCVAAWAAATHLRASMPPNMPVRPDTRSSRVSNRARTGSGTSEPILSFRVQNSLPRARIPLTSRCRVPPGGSHEIGSDTFTSEATMVAAENGTRSLSSKTCAQTPETAQPPRTRPDPGMTVLEADPQRQYNVLAPVAGERRR